MTVRLTHRAKPDPLFRSMPAERGLYFASGFAAGLRPIRKINAGYGIYNVAGQSVTLTPGTSAPTWTSVPSDPQFVQGISRTQSLIANTANFNPAIHRFAIKTGAAALAADGVTAAPTTGLTYTSPGAAGSVAGVVMTIEDIPPPPPPPGPYSTTFPANESIISESGNWSNIASPWKKIRTSGGNALAASYTDNYDDAFSILETWTGGNNYEITAQVYFPSGSAGEVELLTRATQTASTIRCYECLYNTGGGFQFVLWNGPFQDFTYLDTSTSGYGGNNVWIRCRVQGSTLTAWDSQNGTTWTQRKQITDTTLATGKPGMSIYVHTADGNINTVGFQSWSVVAV